MEEKYLPVGTVVYVNDAEKAMMITGYRMIDENGEEFDYCGCMYPYGNQDKGFGVFNHSEITEVLHKGYDSEIFQKYNEFLKRK